jgi:hypothetical protein
MFLSIINVVFKHIKSIDLSRVNSHMIYLKLELDKKLNRGLKITQLIKFNNTIKKFFILLIFFLN